MRSPCWLKIRMGSAHWSMASAVAATRSSDSALPSRRQDLQVISSAIASSATTGLKAGQLTGQYETQRGFAVRALDAAQGTDVDRRAVADTRWRPTEALP